MNKTVMYVLVVVLVLIGVANLVLFALTEQTMTLVLGLVLTAAGLVNLYRLKNTSNPGAVRR